MFFRKAHQRTDFKLGLAGLLAGIHALRLIAQSGQVSREDLQVSIDGVKAILSDIPAGDLSREEISNIFEILDEIVVLGKLSRSVCDTDNPDPPIGSYRALKGYDFSASHVEKWDGQKWVVTRNPDSIGESR